MENQQKVKTIPSIQTQLSEPQTISIDETFVPNTPDCLHLPWRKPVR